VFSTRKPTVTLELSLLDVQQDRYREFAIMFAILAILLLIAWGLALFAFHVTGFFIHIVLVLALIMFVVHFFTRRASGA
jgi:hypothetical protein